ncbi:MAG: Hsp20 family protein, partial [Microbacterium sp.]
GGEGVKWITREREAASFLRQLNLGQGIDNERIAANYSNGVLSVTIPVSEKAKPRKVEVATDNSAPVIQAHETSDGPQPVEQ